MTAATADFSIGLFALEARADFERRDRWFFFLQSMLATEHLTDVQRCDPETVAYIGVHFGKHVWSGHG